MVIMGNAAQVAKANRALESEVRGTSEGVGVGCGVHEQLLAQPALCEQFVGLLCQFEPSAVLPFLQSHDGYRCYSTVCIAQHLYRCLSKLHCVQQALCSDCQIHDKSHLSPTFPISQKVCATI